LCQRIRVSATCSRIFRGGAKAIARAPAVVHLDHSYQVQYYYSYSYSYHSLCFTVGGLSWILVAYILGHKLS
jgi:hypothetical protein